MKERTDEDSLVLQTDQSIPQSPLGSLQIDECHEIKIVNAYDPSKFWLIWKIQELALFMKYLKEFYSEAANRRNVSPHSLKRELVCVVFRNNKYYRSVVQPLCFPDRNRVRVFMVDYGLITTVSLDSIFHIHKKHCTVPRFSVRACLTDIQPHGGNKMWSQTDLKSFCALIHQRQLAANIYHIDTKRHILFIDIQVCGGTMRKSVTVSLIRMRIAQNFEQHDNTNIDNLSNYTPKVKHLCLCPTFEAIEGGMVPCSIWEHDLLKDAVPLDMLYKNYYQYNVEK